MKRSAMALRGATREMNRLQRRLLESKVKGIREDKKLTNAQKKAKIAKLKLARELHGLAAKLDRNGNYAAGNVIVKNGRIEVAVYVTDLGEKTHKALQRLGFEKILESPGVKMVLGRIEVAKLEDLAQLDEVRRIGLPTVLK